MKDEDKIIMGGLALLVLSKKKPTVTISQPPASQQSVPPSLQQYFTVQKPVNVSEIYQSAGMKITSQIRDSSGQYVYANEFDTGFWLNEGEGKTLIINAPRVVKVAITPKSTTVENYKIPTLFINGHIIEFPSMFQTFMDGKQINNGNYIAFYDTSSLVIQSRAGKFNLLVQIYVAPDTVKCSENDMGSVINVNCG